MTKETHITEEIYKTWQEAKKHIQQSIASMTQSFRENDVEASMDYVRAFVEREEYVLAIEELVSIGKLNTFQKPFWESLLNAAKSMNLDSSIKQIEGFL